MDGSAVHRAAAVFTAAACIRRGGCAAVGAGDCHLGRGGLLYLLTHIFSYLRQHLPDLLAELFIIAVLDIGFRIAPGGHARTHCRRRRNVHGTGVELEAYFVKVRVVDEYGDVEVIGVFIARRIVADLLAVLILAHEFRTALVNIKIAAGHVCKVQNIRVCLLQISCSCYHKLSRVLVQKHLGVRAERPGGVERRNLLPVFLTVGKLRLDLLDGAAAPVGKPG